MSGEAAVNAPFPDLDDAIFDSLKADIAAFAARNKWLEYAHHTDRKGKQLLPAGDQWTVLLWRGGRGWG